MGGCMKTRPDVLTCEYCGKVKEDFTFMIGASKNPEWCMHEGTGKMSCPDCYKTAQEEAQKRINRHINNVNKQENK